MKNIVFGFCVFCIMLITQLNVHAYSQDCEGVFADVQIGNQFCPHIEYIYKQGIVDYSQVYMPDTNINREDFTHMVVGAFKIELDTNGVNFPDMSSEHEYYNEVLTLKNLKIISGTSAGLFKPDDPITRNEAAKIIINSINYKFPGTIAINTDLNDIPPFKDLDNINRLNSYIVDLYNYTNINQLNVINGFSDGTIKPQTNISKEQTAKILANLMIALRTQKWECSTRYCTDIKLEGFPVFDFELEMYLFDLINNSRVEKGIQPFIYNTGIAALSDNWNRSMAEQNILSHNLNFTSQLKNANITFLYNGENVATRTISDINNKKSYFEAVDFLHNTILSQLPPNDQHRQNIFSQSYPFNHIGLSVLITKDYLNPTRNRVWIVQNFIQTS